MSNPTLRSKYSMFPIKRTVFFSTVAVHKNTVRLIGNKEYEKTEHCNLTRKFVCKFASFHQPL